MVIANRTIEALTSYQHVIILTHVPPFLDPAWSAGRISDDVLPFYVCKAVGDRLMEIGSAHPEQSLTILCGHVHTPGVVHLLSNVVMHTGAARTESRWSSAYWKFDAAG